MIGPIFAVRRSGGAALVALALAAAPSAGCAFAVEHPAITAGVVGGTLGLGTCKLASDNLGACLAVGGGAGGFLAVVAAAAIWLGGDGHTAPTEDLAQPLPDDGQPPRRHRRPAPAADPDAAPPDGTPPSPSPASPPPTSSQPGAVQPAPAAPPR